jgi:hypothetical protein
LLLAVCILVLLLCAEPAFCWSNGGYSADPAHPDYGTHDWISQHALDYLPAEEKQYITDNLAAYLYGTELPDLPASQGGIGDASAKHHIYFYANGSLQDASAAQRASEEYQKALDYLKNGNYSSAAKEAGIMSHYIDDMGVFCHVMGANTDWRAESSSTHSNYESYVDGKTGSYDSAVFNGYLHYDGVLSIVSASDSAKTLAYNSTFGDNGAYSCTWMNSNYNWSNLAFKNRCGESLNLAVNAVADVLNTLYLEASPPVIVSPTIQPPTPTPTLTTQPTATPTTTNSPTLTSTSSPSQTPITPELPTAPAIITTILAVTALAVVYREKAKKSEKPF